MKKIILPILLIACFIANAQSNKSKSNPSMQDIEKELKELEKEDPEMAKKVREMMKQHGQPIKKTTPKSPAKFVSPITPIPLKTPAIPPTDVQATDNLLWYKGKKLNDSLLVTTNGTLILYRRKKNEVIVQPDPKKDPFKKMVTELSNTEKRKSDLISYIAPQKNSFFYYPAIISTLKEYDNASANFHDLLKNTIKLPPAISTSTSFKPGKSSTGYASLSKYIVMAEIPEAIKKVHDEAMDNMKNYPPLDFPEPPARDFSICYDCDSSIANSYKEQCREWEEDFSAYEATVINKALSVIQALSKEDLEEKPEAIQMKADMDKVIEFGMNRVRNKCDLLIRKYGNDYSRLPLVIKKVLSYERQKQLIANDEGGYSATMEKIISLLDGFDTFIGEQMKARNYNLVFNMAFIIGVERQKQLLGASEENPVEYFDKFMAFNRFRLSIDMDASISSEDLMADAGAITTKDVYVSLGLNNCRFNFYLSSADFRKGEEYDFRMPMTAKGGVKKQKDENDEWVSYNYSGAKDILGLFPPISISFCDDGMDSIFMQPPINKFENMTINDAKSVTHAYTIDHTAFLGMLFIKGTEEAAMEGEDIALETIAAYSSNHLEQSTGNAKLDELQSEYNLSVKTKELQNKMSTAINQQTMLILFDAQNKNDVIVDSETTPSHSFQDEFSVKGKVKIKIVHDPAPY